MDWLQGIILSITAIISALTGMLIALNKLRKEFNENIPKKLLRQTNIDNDILARMEDLKDILKADRVQIYDFHNGEHYASGKSALRCSCTYETVRAGVLSKQFKLQSIPLSVIPQFVKILIENQELEVLSIEEMKTTMPSTYALKKAQGIKSFYDIILNNREKEPIGFIAVQYIGEAHKKFTSEEIEEVKKLKYHIEDNLEELINKYKKGGRLWK